MHVNISSHWHSLGNIALASLRHLTKIFLCLFVKDLCAITWKALHMLTNALIISIIGFGCKISTQARVALCVCILSVTGWSLCIVHPFRMVTRSSTIRDTVDISTHYFPHSGAN